MLVKRERITITGESVLENGTVLEGFQATIASENPEDVQFTSWQQDKAAYKANRSVARADEAEFEDYVYSIQDNLIAKAATVSEEE